MLIPRFRHVAYVGVLLGSLIPGGWIQASPEGRSHISSSSWEGVSFESAPERIPRGPHLNSFHTGHTGELAFPLNQTSLLDLAVSSAPFQLAQVDGTRPAPPGAPPSKPDEKKEKKEEGSGSGSPAKPDPVIVITRPQKPEAPPDPKELEIRPDEQGRVRFNFSRQPWPAVLEWLATVSKLSLDWQELPGDYLNLQTQRDYSLEEARDLINKHLLARGFTMIRNGEMLTVVNISKLNSAIVPRYSPDELERVMPSEFVRVSFPLDWLLAEKTAEELKPMLSPNGKLTALKELNRLEAMDTAGNLLEIARILKQTQSSDNNKTTVVREFRLKHRRAGDVVVLVESILGLDPKRSATRIPRSGGGGGSDMMSFQIMNQMQQMQQQFQQMQQQQRGGAAGGTPQEPEPRLIVNDHENSILAHATPDKMEIITQTIRAIDVPNEESDDLSQIAYRVKPYRLFTADPEPIMLLLKEMGNLSPMCRIQVDEKSKSLILYGTLADHYVTQTLISRLDGTNRSFEVVPLRRLQAEAVAGTIQYLMGAEDEEKPKTTNRYSFFGGYQGNNSRENKEERPFKVDADIVNNRLLLWANDVELEEVRNLLIKMGETPPGKSNPETIRSIDLQSDEESRQLLQQLKQLWPEIDSIPLDVRPSPASPSAIRPQTSPQSHVPASAPDALHDSTPVSIDPDSFDSISFDGGKQEGSSLRPSAPAQPLRVAMWQASVETASPSAELPPPVDAEQLRSPETSATATRPGIEIQVLPNGRIVYSSPDTEALDRLESLIGQLAPPRRDYHIFHLKHPTTWAYGIETILEDFFKDESNKESVYDPWWGTTTTKISSKSRLSRQKELKIISNDDSQTILVQGATPEQLKIIGELIDVYDRQSASDPQALRRTEIFQLQYSRAPAIAETIKQVYRDLLSANDPALQNPNQQKPPEEPKFTYIMGRANTEEKSDSPAQPIKFKGLLSVGVDENSNSVIISSTEGLMREIRGLIERLDLAAKPSNTVQVLQVRNINTEILQQRLGRSFTSPTIRFSESGRHRPQDDNNKPSENDAQNNNAPQQNGKGGNSNQAGSGARNGTGN